MRSSVYQTSNSQSPPDTIASLYKNGTAVGSKNGLAVTARSSTPAESHPDEKTLMQDKNRGLLDSERCKSGLFSFVLNAENFSVMPKAIDRK